jgi:pyrroloquinoline quinone (PQQ) biosynthesis protein C
MASRNPQTMAKRAREQAVKERRDRKRAKKAEAAAERAAARDAEAAGISQEEVTSHGVADAPSAELVVPDR